MELQLNRQIPQDFQDEFAAHVFINTAPGGRVKVQQVVSNALQQHSSKRRTLRRLPSAFLVNSGIGRSLSVCIYTWIHTSGDAEQPQYMQIYVRDGGGRYTRYDHAKFNSMKNAEAQR